MKSPFCLPAVLPALCLGALSFFCPNVIAGTLGTPSAPAAGSPEVSTVNIPGPLRSFMRMAGISQKVSADEVLPLLARNVYYQGYEGPANSGHETEFLVLLRHYLQQARELSGLAGADGTIRVSGCQQVEPLLRILGYRVRRGECGQSNTSLETADAERAFLTIDAGFPLPELERSLQGKQDFVYPFAASPVPVLFSPNDWMIGERRRASDDFLDLLLDDRGLARFYWAMSHLDRETRDALRQSPGLAKLAPLGAVLDFYGSYICIRSGRVEVPGGSAAESAWRDLVGAHPESAGEFTLRLLSRDRGWLAAFFDALSRVPPSQQAHFTNPRRLRRSYEALREEDKSSGAAQPVFRPDPGLLLLLTRMRWEDNGELYIPGNLGVWKEILQDKRTTDVRGKWRKRVAGWTTSEQLLEAMFAFSRVRSEHGPVQIYLALSELDARRAPGHRMSPQTVLLMAQKFAQFSSQDLIFSEFPELDDSAIADFLNAAESLNNLGNHTLRGNAMGMFQAEIGIWQILARQHQIPEQRINSSWHNLVKSFAHVTSSAQLFDAGRGVLTGLLLAANAEPSSTQDEIIGLLAGPRQTNPQDQQVRQELANRMRAVMDGQRLISLDTILGLGDGLHRITEVRSLSDNLLRLAGDLREFEMPQPIFSMSEREEWATGVYNSHHTDLQMRTDLSKIIKSPTSEAQLTLARGQLAPFLRDTLVGLNYAYYQPPGAQILLDNPLFVRSHDFSGETVMGLENSLWQAPQLFGQGAPAGGGAHFIGSLADLPYALAEAEQNFLAPKNIQALIWEQMVPGLLTSAVVPRFWGISRHELHAVALYQKAGEEILAASAGNEALQREVDEILSESLSPQKMYRLRKALAAGSGADILLEITPADSFRLTAEFRRKYPGQAASWGPAGEELEKLAQGYPSEVGWKRLSRDFGTPHPFLTRSYAREVLDVSPFPAFMGYSSRLMAESWDSSNLYWARLADEKGYSAAQLNQLVPELTRRMIENIFATDQEDWAALLRATRETGDEFLHGKVASLTMSADAARH